MTPEIIIKLKKTLDSYDNQLVEDANYFYKKLMHTFDWFIYASDDEKVNLLQSCYTFGFKNFLSSNKEVL